MFFFFFQAACIIHLMIDISYFLDTVYFAVCICAAATIQGQHLFQACGYQQQLASYLCTGQSSNRHCHCHMLKCSIGTRRETIQSLALKCIGQKAAYNLMPLGDQGKSYRSFQ